MVEHALSHPLWFANNVMKRDAFKVVLLFLSQWFANTMKRVHIYMLLILCNKCVFCPTWLGCVLQAVNRAQIVPPLGIYYFTKIAIFCIDIKFLFVRKWHQPSLSRWPTNCFLDELLSSKHVKPLFYLLPKIPWKQLNCDSPGLKLKHQLVATEKFLPLKV